jgi:hypothetical protein
MTITPQQRATAIAAARAELKLQSQLEDSFGIGLWFEDPAGADGMRIDGLLNLPALVNAVLDANRVAPTVIAQAPVVTTIAELCALPSMTVIRTAKGSIACRYDAELYTTFGDERAHYPWSALALPVTILHNPTDHQEPTP